MTRLLPTPCKTSGGYHNPDNGYPYSSYMGKPDKLSRIVWRKTNGPIPSGMVVRHICDNIKCIAIDHLELGTQGDNMVDRVQRARRNNTNLKLTPDDVRNIRKRLSQGDKGIDIAFAFQVSKHTVSLIKNGKSWQHVL